MKKLQEAIEKLENTHHKAADQLHKNTVECFKELSAVLEAHGLKNPTELPKGFNPED